MKLTLKGYTNGIKFPKVKIKINNTEMFNDFITEELNNFVFNITPENKNILEITHYNKKNTDTIITDNGNKDVAIEIVSVYVNDLKIKDTVLYSCPYYVDWFDSDLQSYNSNGQLVPEFINNTLYFGYNGTYKFEFLNSAEKMHYYQLWQDEQQAHMNQTIKDNEQEKFIRFNEEVKVDDNNDFTIFDLEKLVTK